MSQKRNIFEEVGEQSASKPAPKGGMIDQGRGGARRGIRAWLMVLFAMVVVMIVVGGLTRLTDSGLSITEWRPVTGAIPPLSEADWQSEFDKYKQIDQWAIDNQWMTLDDFKFIYWWEWGHRQIGRVIGLVWAVGFFGFLAARKIPVGWTGRLAFIGGLGGLQGAVGWWMVASGVTSGEGVTTVASYRLATHLGLAFLILGCIAWYVMLLGREERELMQARRQKEKRQFGVATGWLHLTALQILIGALVAGIDAGRSYNDWPLMAGQFFPSESFDIEPLWRNFFENPALVQFIHRIVGYLLLGYSVMAWMRGRKSAHSATRAAFTAAFIAVVAQIVLGIYTVVTAAPWNIAIVHQVFGILVFVLILRARFLSAHPIVASLRG
ncbi:heme A synthase [Thalassobius sp. Cn5-15]|uniref:heme A synthase n=1 Tax=Thalassobius sp. Cn5-15 TaxID=2917763 RepID=UPI001EF1F739|nr:heme A synthase [Thalassobius sp. Cn5-15]MCG7491927.1 COX15/CtaA family protein [Thalassobius sp. Cn5-15]